MAIAETLSELDKDSAKSLQDVIDSRNYEALGRKIISMSCDYMEKLAMQVAENEF